MNCATSAEMKEDSLRGMDSSAGKGRLMSAKCATPAAAEEHESCAL